MTKDEALKLALEFIERVNKDGWILADFEPQMYEAITAIKEALAQPEQEPVAWKLVPIEPTNEMLKAMDECSKEGYDERLYAGHAASVYMAAVDVAPTPPQRTWVGLTDEEIEDAIDDGFAFGLSDGNISNQAVIRYVRIIEAKLKEKNA